MLSFFVGRADRPGQPRLSEAAQPYPRQQKETQRETGDRDIGWGTKNTFGSQVSAIGYLVQAFGFRHRWRRADEGIEVGLTTLGQPRLSEGAQPYPRQNRSILSGFRSPLERCSLDPR